MPSETPLLPDHTLLDIIKLSKSAIGIYTGEEVRIQFANDEMISFWGKDRTVIGRPMGEAVPELVGQPFIGILQEVWRSGQTYSAENVPVELLVNGRMDTFYFTFEYRALTNQQGQTYAILHTASNVTENNLAAKKVKEHEQREQDLVAELKASNEELISLNEEYLALNHEQEIVNKTLAATNTRLQESEHRFRNMAEGSGILIGVGDASGDVIYFNQAWSTLTGKPMDELLAFGWANLIHPDDKEDYLNLYLNAVKQRVAYTGEYRILAASGEYRWLLAFASPRLDTDGSFAGFIGSFIDITERKKDEQRKSDFIGMVSHELKTPLTSMKGYVQMLKAKAQKTEDSFTANILDKANNQVNKMTTLINGFLNVSRLESGKIHIDKQVFDMAALVKETEEESLATVSSHKVVFAPVVETIVKADRDKIGQVINNLISNAVKYSPAGSTINVACVTINNKAMVSVRDEGMGIDPKDIDRLFERYYRVDSKNMTSISGFGIGLYLSSEIIERHGGNIGVESVLGKGSTFWFTLPIDIS